VTDRCAILRECVAAFSKLASPSSALIQRNANWLGTSRMLAVRGGRRLVRCWSMTFLAMRMEWQFHLGFTMWPATRASSSWELLTRRRSLQSPPSDAGGCGSGEHITLTSMNCWSNATAAIPMAIAAGDGSMGCSRWRMNSD